MRNRRVQLLPVQWRASLRLNSEEAKVRENDGLDNDFTLAGEVLRHISWTRRLPRLAFV